MLLFDGFLLFFIGVAVVFDLWRRRIPNWLVLPTIAAALLLSPFRGMDSLMGSVLGLGLGMGSLLVPFAFGWLGAGDVKLSGAIGALLGAQWLPAILFYSSLTGLLLALVALVCRAMQRKAVRTIPLAVAIGLGTLIAVYLDPNPAAWMRFG